MIALVVLNLLSLVLIAGLWLWERPASFHFWLLCLVFGTETMLKLAQDPSADEALAHDL